MPYAASVPFRGDPDKALRLAEAALTGIGFRHADRTAESIEMLGPGMNSSRESPLVGASRIRLTAGRSELAAEADLGGVERMARFVTLFPPALCLSLGLTLIVVFGLVFGMGPWLLGAAAAPVGVTLVWLVLGPWMARHFRARTCRALDTLLANMAAAGEAR